MAPKPHQHPGNAPAHLTQRGKLLRGLPWKRLAVLFIALVGAYSSYLLLTNLLLPQRLESTATRMGLELHIGSADSLIPGTLYLREIRLSDVSAGWSVQAESARCTFDVGRWLLGSIHITSLSAEGTTVDLATRSSQDKRAALPPLGPNVPASVLAAAVSLDTETVTAANVEASGDWLRLGDHQISGDIRYRMSRVHMGTAETEVHAELEVSDGYLVYDDDPTASIDGRVTLDIPPATAGSREVWERATWSIDATGTLKSLSPWLQGGRHQIELHGARYRTDFVLRGTELSAGQLELTAKQAALIHADDAKTEIDGRARARLSISDDAGRPLSVQLNSDSLRLIDPTGERWAHLADFEFGLELNETAPKAGWTTGALHVRSSESTFRVLASTIGGKLEARLPVVDFDRRGSLTLGNGTIRANRWQLRPLGAPTPGHLFDMSLNLSRALLSTRSGLDFSGRIEVTGRDGELLLDLADASETVRWTLSLFSGEPFTLQANVIDRDRWMLVEQLRLRSAGLTARGAFYELDDEKHGALLVDGPLKIGVSFHSGQLATQVPADDSWLTRSLESIRKPPRLRRE